MAIIPLIYLMIKKSYRLRTSVHSNRKISWDSDRLVRRHISRLTEPFVQVITFWKTKKKRGGGTRTRRSWEGNKDLKILGNKQKKRGLISSNTACFWVVSLLISLSFLPSLWFSSGCLNLHLWISSMTIQTLPYISVSFDFFHSAICHDC